MKRFAMLTLCALMTTALAGCISGPPRNNAYWVQGHYGPNGGWEHGHWQERQ